jgi:hypothetical protein
MARNRAKKNGFKELSREEGQALFDRLTHRYFQMSGEDFLRAWKEGRIDLDQVESPDAERVLMMLPLAT